jgi:peptide/nickel transport system ATP-binding protein
MYAGRVVEELHPYTKGLLNCLPRIGGPKAAAAGAEPRSGTWANGGAG